MRDHGPYPVPIQVPPGVVEVRRRELVFPTYAAGEPSPHPLFCERRVYQGSSGAIYPLPVIAAVADRAAPTAWECVVVENAWIQLVVLPALGGRIMRLYDKAAGYDVFYRQDVIKPALVGLAGPWMSGGVEFNWPQHHRPSTWMPADAAVEREADGTVVVWLSEHEPMERMRGRIGLAVDPRSSRLSARVAIVNRTPLTRTFLWWANVAAEVHDEYQSFFPPDVWYVADHAVRSMSTFPIARDRYYGVDYRPGTDLTWYRNIPVPTSYMVRETGADFFGGYDHRAGAGFVHVADRRIAPGKKQWTWGDHAFGRAWDRRLTDPGPDGRCPPYIELMAGVYTDNQPDFSYLAPYETRRFAQTWWPIQGTGPVHAASADAALRLDLADGRAELRIAAPAPLRGRLRLRIDGRPGPELALDCGPGRPATLRCALDPALPAQALEAVVEDEAGRALLTYRPPAPVAADRQPPPPAREPPAPADCPSGESLVLIAEHLEQYRHPTRDAGDWLAEALRRDPGDARANVLAARRLLARGDAAAAEPLLRAAVARLTAWHPNAMDVEAWYLLGLACEWQGRDDEADAAHGRALWQLAWRGAAAYRLALIAARRGRWEEAVARCDEALEAHAGHAQARDLAIAVLRRAGRGDAARARAAAAADPLDPWLDFERELLGLSAPGSWAATYRQDAQTALDVAGDLIDAGDAEAADAALAAADAEASAAWVRAWLAERRGDPAARDAAARAAFRLGGRTGLFPQRRIEEAALAWAAERADGDPWPAWAVGCLRWHRRRPAAAVAAWRRAAAVAADDPRTRRCLGLAAFNIDGDPAAALAHYDAAVAAAPADGALLAERDQLMRRMGIAPARRLAALAERPAVVAGRDDLACALAELRLIAGDPAEALAVLAGRSFHPWEGGEGRAMAVHVAAHLALARAALARGDAAAALALADAAAADPPHLGEAKHLLAATADIAVHRGAALAAAGSAAAATDAFRAAAEAAQDFADMAVQAVSPMTLWQALAWRRLGRADAAEEACRRLAASGEALLRTPGRIDYFATSLPDLLVFNHGQAGLDRRNRLRGLLHLALAAVGRGEADADRRLAAVLAEDPAQADAALIARARADGTWISP